MKLLVLTFTFSCCITNLFSQTDELNLEKYWKFRNDFVQKFIKIGPDQGESLPAGSIEPFACFDNNGENDTEYGKMQWGDGMIRHGFYLRLLATEYALKKKYGQDTQGTLNELYYALYAINRLDRDAELNLDDLYDIDGFYGPNINGFYLREDVGEDFCLNWETDQLNARCTNSAYYENNNYAKIHNPSINLITKPNPSHRNSPSLDQMTSLLVGLSLVNELVDNVSVEPIPNEGFNILDETRAITARLVEYTADHNWEIIDVNGWPAPNGTLLDLEAYPIYLAYLKITGNSPIEINTFYQRNLDRYHPKFNEIQHCRTGFGLNGGPNEALTSCQTVFNHPAAIGIYNELALGSNAGIWNNQTSSVFQAWNQGVTNYIGASAPYWNSYNPSLPFFINSDHFNRMIKFNSAVISGLWNDTQITLATFITQNYEMELTNFILNDNPLTQSRQFYKSKLDGLSSNGPYDFEKWNYTGPPTYSAQVTQVNGWGSTYRWVNEDDAYGENHEKGLYNALDYMVFHNLYYLIFGDEIAEPFKETYKCFCEPQIQTELPANTNSLKYEAKSAINKQLLHIPTCQPNVFEPVFNLVTSGTFDVAPKFADYADLEISTAKFQTMDALITSSGVVNAISHLIICNAKTLTVQTFGELNATYGNIVVNEDAAINLSGKIRIEDGNTLFIKSGAKLIMHNGSELMLNEGSRIVIEDGGILEYYDGAEILSDGENAEFVLEGTVKMMNGGVFRINHDASAFSGRIIFKGSHPNIITESGVMVQAEIHLVGKDMNDEFVIIKENSRILVNNHENTNVDKLIIHSCKTVLSKGAKIETRKYFNTYDATYISEAINDGINVSAYNKFSGCDFKNVPIIANLQFTESQKLWMISCNMLNEAGVNDAHDAMVAVDGIGMHVNNCTFVGSNAVLVKSKNMLFPSQVSLSTFNRNTPFGQAITTFGIEDLSNTELKLISCSFNGMRIGAFKNGGDLTLRCNTFNNSQLFDVGGEFGCIVNASANDYGGYNYFNSVSTLSNSSNIYVNHADINVNNGKNKFNNSAGLHILGRLNQPCGINTNCLIRAGNNQWNSGLQIPAQVKFNVVGDDNLPFTVAADITQLIPPCGTDDPTGPFSGIFPGNSGSGQQQGQNNGNGVGPGSNNGNGNGNSPFANNSSLPFIGTSFGSNIRLDHAVAYGRDKMKPNNPNGDDEQAIDIFDEIFNVNIPKNSRQVKDWLNGSLNDMKTSLENEVYEQRIAGQLGQSGIEFYINEYLDALNYMTDSTIVDSNYTESFYLELDKAHLYRILGDPTSGLEILTKTETCGLDKEEQGVLNYWKRELELDIKIDQLEMSYLDTVVEIDTSLYATPTIYNPPQFYFGTRFITLNDREYSTCTNGARVMGQEYVQASMGFSIYPNPASSRINIEFNEFKEYKNVQVLFLTSDGRIVEQLELGSESAITEHSVRDWNPGVYFYELIIEGNKASIGKLIIQ